MDNKRLIRAKDETLYVKKCSSLRYITVSGIMFYLSPNIDDRMGSLILSLCNWLRLSSVYAF